MGFTSPQPIVGRVYPSTLAFYPSKGRVDGSLDEAVCIPLVPLWNLGNLETTLKAFGSFLSLSGEVKDPTRDNV